MWHTNGVTFKSPKSDIICETNGLWSYNNIPIKNSHVGSILNRLWSHGPKDISQITNIVWKSQWFVRVCWRWRILTVYITRAGCTHTTHIFGDVFIESFTQVSCFMLIFASFVPFVMTHSSHIILRVWELLEIRLYKVYLEPIIESRAALATCTRYMFGR